MRLLRKYRNSLMLSVIFSVVSTLAIFVAIPNYKENIELLFKIFASLFFWLGTLFEILTIIKTTHLRKMAEKRYQVFAKGLPGIVSFFKTPYGKITDIVFVVSTILYIVLELITQNGILLKFILIFLMFLSFRLHCIANGKNYRYLIFCNKKEREL